MITVVVPAYNEEEVIKKFIDTAEREIKLEEPYELLIVNDGSRDRTKEIVQQLQKKYNNIRLVNHEKNKGLGGAIRTGIKEAKGHVIVTLDSDLTHPPAMVPQLVKAIKGVEVSIASRYVGAGGMRNVPAWRCITSRAANFSFALMLGSLVGDITAGFKAYDAKLVKSLPLKQNGFEIQLEIMMQLLKHNARYHEIPFVLVNRKVGASKFSFFRMVPKYFVNMLKIIYTRWFG